MEFTINMIPKKHKKTQNTNKLKKKKHFLFFRIIFFYLWNWIAGDSFSQYGQLFSCFLKPIIDLKFLYHFVLFPFPMAKFMPAQDNYTLLP